MESGCHRLNANRQIGIVRWQWIHMINTNCLQKAIKKVFSFMIDDSCYLFGPVHLNYCVITFIDSFHVKCKMMLPPLLTFHIILYFNFLWFMSHHIYITLVVFLVEPFSYTHITIIGNFIDCRLTQKGLEQDQPTA